MYQDLLYQKQAERITALTDLCRRLETQNQSLQAEVARYERPAKFYLRMQELILDNPTLLSEWHRFIAVLKLGMDDEAGFTRIEDRHGLQ